MNFDEVKKEIKTECNANGIRFFAGRGKTVKNGTINCNGFFCDGEDYDTGEKFQPTLAFANNPNSFDVLVHEYCHMQQWLEGSPLWSNLRNNGFMWDWLNGDDSIEFSKVEDSMLAYYGIELDCERRAIAQHRKWKTKYRKELYDYIQKANAYTMFYFYLIENRKWYKAGKEPYNLKSVWSKMPKSFTFNRLKCYNQVSKLFDKCI